MISVIVSKITGAEKNNISLCYSNTMVRDRIFHILRFLHFENNDNPPNCDDTHYDRLWKIIFLTPWITNFMNCIIQQNIWQLMKSLFSSKEG